MNRRSKIWLMHIAQWFKTVYEATLGPKYPYISYSICVGTVLLIATVCWNIGRNAYEKDKAAALRGAAAPVAQAPAVNTGDAKASGSGSIANTGNGNTITSSTPSPSK